MHLNVRSLMKKIDQVRMLMEGSNIDVFTVSETWLKPHLNTSLVTLPNYQPFRLDRNFKNKPKKKGGGLISYVSVKHASSCEVIDELNISNECIEAQWLYIYRPHCKNVIICNVYRPPSGDLKSAISYLDDCLKTLNLVKADLFLLGDFNINYRNKRSPDYKRFNFFAQSNSLTQHITSTTRNTDKTKSLLDLALTNSKFIDRAGTLEHYISDHQPIYIVHKKGRDNRQSVEFDGRSYRSFDSKKFRAQLLELEWEDLYQMTDPEEAWNFILKQITIVLNVMCPVRSFHIKNYRPDWMTKELIEQIKDRDYFYSKAKAQGDGDAWNVAKHLRNVTNSNIRQAKKDFILGELETHDDDPKKFWKVIQKVVPSKDGSTSRDILLKHDGSKIDRNKVAQYINDYFINVGNFSLPDSQVLAQDEQSNSGLTSDAPASDAPIFENLVEVTEREVFNLIKDINVSKSSGLANVSSFIVKEAFKALIREVTYMFNLSIRTSIFPADWKLALVIPIPKSGNLTMVKNYRPISLLPLPGKILEKLIHQQLTNYLEQESLLTEDQHGFRKKHSTIHSIAQLSNYISKKMDAKLPTLVAYIDFRKAFDCVQHPVLLRKLTQVGLGKPVTDWVRSYLCSRQQRVYANDTYSSFQTINQGVPQGSVLGPLFYIVYANDLVKTVKNCEIALYADDTVLYTASKDIDRSIASLQEDINSLTEWCNENGIMANTDKTKVMTFGSQNMLGKVPEFEIVLNDTPLQFVTAYKYLGMTLDSRLTYNLHVNKIIGSVSAKLKQFRRMRVFLNTKAALLVYKNMLLPMLEYGDVFLTAASNLNRKRLQILQNKGLRCALNRGLETSTDELHAEANLLKLKFRREQHLLNFMFDQAQIPDLLKVKMTHMVKTRSSCKKTLKIKRPRTEKFKKSLAYLGPKKWNILPEELHHVQSKHAYKILVHNLVIKRSENAVSGKLGVETSADLL